MKSRSSVRSSHPATQPQNYWGLCLPADLGNVRERPVEDNGFVLTGSLTLHELY